MDDESTETLSPEIIISEGGWHRNFARVLLGKIVPGTSIRLPYGGDIYSREANEFGIWGFIAPTGPESTEELPVVVT